MKGPFKIICLIITFSMVLAACATPTAETVIQTVEVPVVQTQVVKETQIQTVIETVEVAAPTAAPTNRSTRSDRRAL